MTPWGRVLSKSSGPGLRGVAFSRQPPQTPHYPQCLAFRHSPHSRTNRTPLQLQPPPQPEHVSECRPNPPPAPRRLYSHLGSLSGRSYSHQAVAHQSISDTPNTTTPPPPHLRRFRHHRSPAFASRVADLAAAGSTPQHPARRISRHTAGGQSI